MVNLAHVRGRRHDAASVEPRKSDAPRSPNETAVKCAVCGERRERRVRGPARAADLGPSHGMLDGADDPRNEIAGPRNFFGKNSYQYLTTQKPTLGGALRSALQHRAGGSIAIVRH